jgi:predicted methyltransferase
VSDRSSKCHEPSQSAESTMLANNDDRHSIKVFDPSIKGETDRFAYRFVKT